LNIDNSYIYSKNDASGRCIYFNPSAPSSRLRLYNSNFVSGGTSGADPLIEITSTSLVNMYSCQFTAKGIQNCLLFSGTATCDGIYNSRFECSSTSGSVAPLVAVTATVTGTYSFVNTGFVYSSTADKSGNPNASGIWSSSVGNNRIIVLYCSFFLLGTTTANYAVQDTYFGTAYAMACLYYMNGASLNNAFSIHAVQNVNKFQLQVVS
jgi:hypothetical protein